MKGKSVKTKFEKPSVTRQPNAFKSQRQSILGKSATFLDSLAKKYFPKSKSITINNVSNDLSKPVTTQILPQNENQVQKNTNVIAPGIVITTTSVSRPQLKINRLEDRVSHNNSQGKKQDVEDHLNQSVATPHKKSGALESTIQKPRSTFRKLYEHVSKTCSWWYPKITPLGYRWESKSKSRNVYTNVIMPLGIESRTSNILEPKTVRGSTLSNTPLYSTSFAARRDNSIHRQLWVLKAHDEKSQASN
ncbi:hypothetical protein Tco_0473092 [Tanacetum coccineum]